MKSPTTIVFALFTCCHLLAAAEAPEKREEASTRMELTRPADGGAFAGTIRDFRRQKFDERPFDWKDVDGKTSPPLPSPKRPWVP